MPGLYCIYSASEVVRQKSYESPDLKVGDIVLTPNYGPGIIIEVLEIFVDVIIRHNGEVNYLAFAKIIG